MYYFRYAPRCGIPTSIERIPSGEWKSESRVYETSNPRDKHVGELFSVTTGRIESFNAGGCGNRQSRVLSTRQAVRCAFARSGGGSYCKRFHWLKLGKGGGVHLNAHICAGHKRISVLQK
jgi:hypothetical protein